MLALKENQNLLIIFVFSSPLTFDSVVRRTIDMNKKKTLKKRYRLCKSKPKIAIPLKKLIDR